MAARARDVMMDWLAKKIFGHSEMAGRAADAILSALDAAGLAVVPKEPTKEMILAGDDALENHRDWTTDSEGTSEIFDMDGASNAVYRAMIAKAQE